MKIFSIATLLMSVSSLACLAQDSGTDNSSGAAVHSLTVGLGGGTIDVGTEGKPSFGAFEIGYNWRFSPVISAGASFWFMSIESDPGTGGSVGVKVNAIPMKEETKFSIYGLSNFSFGRAMLTTRLYTQEYAIIRMLELGPGVEWKTKGRITIFAQGTYSFGGQFFGQNLHFLRGTAGTLIRL